MRSLPVLIDSDEAVIAIDLIATHGDLAFEEARARADHSRDIGNHIHFCRWRQVGRMIDFLTDDVRIGALN